MPCDSFYWKWFSFSNSPWMESRLAMWASASLSSLGGWRGRAGTMGRPAWREDLLSAAGPCCPSGLIPEYTALLTLRAVVVPDWSTRICLHLPGLLLLPGSFFCCLSLPLFTPFGRPRVEHMFPWALVSLKHLECTSFVWVHCIVVVRFYM